MTTTTSFRFLLLCLAAAALLACALSAVRYVNVTHADPVSSTATPIAAPSSAAAPDRTIQGGADIDGATVERLWRGGAMLPACLVGIYLAIAFLFRIDRKRAFYWGGALTAAGLLVESAARGVTPTAGMFFAAIGTLAAILTRGPTQPRETP